MRLFSIIFFLNFFFKNCATLMTEKLWESVFLKHIINVKMHFYIFPFTKCEFFYKMRLSNYLLNVLGLYKNATIFFHNFFQKLSLTCISMHVDDNFFLKTNF